MLRPNESEYVKEITKKDKWRSYVSIHLDGDRQPINVRFKFPLPARL